jgi:DDE_Tnp_1-associated
MMLREYLERIEDPRRKQGQRYKLGDILLVSVIGILSGALSYRDLERFMRLRLVELKGWLGLNWKRAPSKSLLSDIYGILNRESLEEGFRVYSQALNQKADEALEKNSYGLDGKALKGSFDHMKEQKMLQILSVFCTGTDLILAHREIPEKTNEIPEAQELIRKLGLPEGSIYTLDALHCQKNSLKR